jgi:hypothetical protein
MCLDTYQLIFAAVQVQYPSSNDLTHAKGSRFDSVYFDLKLKCCFSILMPCKLHKSHVLNLLDHVMHLSVPYKEYFF